MNEIQQHQENIQKSITNGFKELDILKGKKKKAQQKKVEKVMREFKKGKLKSSDGKTVTDRAQAVAIALSEAGLNKSIEIDIKKGGKKTGFYKNTSENRKKGRVSQKYKKDPSLHDAIHEMSHGNLNVRKFKSADEVKAEVERIRDEFNLHQDVHDINLDIYSDPAMEKFEEIYQTNPIELINHLKISDFEAPFKSKLKGTLVGQNGNAFALMGYFQAKAKKAGWTKDQIKKVIDNAMSEDYDHLVVTLDSQFEPEDEDSQILFKTFNIKSITNKRIQESFGIQKARGKAWPLGTVKDFSGRKLIKEADGWHPYHEGKENLEKRRTFRRMSDDQLKSWINKNDTDEPEISPVFREQIKFAMKEAKRRGKEREKFNKTLRS